MKNLAFQTAPVGTIAAGGRSSSSPAGSTSPWARSAGFAAIISGKIFLGTGIGLWGSLILGALVGLGCGIGNGLLVTLGRVNAFMATLATSIIIYGFAQVVTSGNLVSVQTERFSTLGLGNALGDQLPDLHLVRVRARVRLPALADDLRPLRVRGRRQCGGRPPVRRPCQRHPHRDVRHLRSRRRDRRRDPVLGGLDGAVEREQWHRVRRDHGDRARRDLAVRRRGGDLADRPRRVLPA